ncbi:amidohydrolase family protein [Amycolatopsis pithecellobii]|uniref:Amidohydrolase family protein n=1 Tax=Amycolatopsis pithecellobii TaxID=664692 RepID=A0A6N7Z1N2_9PSEU|nr:amidohydrolase family protein [Amycolatopsis pithecellobii]MTD53781.1 amidohydrolase family protein [Amycolatopsis pithecellobii]
MSSADTHLIRNALLDGHRTDCRITGTTITALGDSLEPREDETVLDAHGATLLPGLADHHLHLFATAAAAASLNLDGATTLPPPDPGTTGWVRAIGAGTELRRTDLDAAWPHRPARVQHRSGALWTLNTAAVDLLSAGLSPDERRTGQLWRADTRLRALLDNAGARAAVDLAALGCRLASYGITHVTDATPDLDAAALQTLSAGIPQHLLSLSAAGTGPRKIVLPDHQYPHPDDLARRIDASHATGRPVAVHVVSSATLAIAIAALDTVGVLPGDRIEHAAVCDNSAADRLAELGIVVVTQPSVYARHAATFERDSDPTDRPWLWRYEELLSRGVRVIASSDAPYGDPNPWFTIRYASQREPSLTPVTVLGSYLTEPTDPAGPPRTITVGAPADLCLHTTDTSTGTVTVTATFAAGIRVH